MVPMHAHMSSLASSYKSAYAAALEPAQVLAHICLRMVRCLERHNVVYSGKQQPLDLRPLAMGQPSLWLFTSDPAVAVALFALQAAPPMPPSLRTPCA